MDSVVSSKIDADSGVRVRQASILDKDFIFSLLPRLAEFNPHRWRIREEMTAGDKRVLESVLSTNSIDRAVLVAEDIDEKPLGFIYLNTAADYYTQEKHGHISDLVVAAAGKGRGIGSILMNAGEKWTKDQGYEFLTLNVFGQNQRARKLYENLGYDEDMIKYVKKLH